MKFLFAAIVSFACSSAFAETYYCYAPAAGAKIIYLSPPFNDNRAPLDVQYDFSEHRKAEGKSIGGTLCISAYAAGDLVASMRNLVSTYQGVGYSFIAVTP